MEREYSVKHVILFHFRLKSGFKTEESNGENKILKSNSKDWLHWNTTNSNSYNTSNCKEKTSRTANWRVTVGTASLQEPSSLLSKPASLKDTETRINIGVIGFANRTIRDSTHSVFCLVETRCDYEQTKAQHLRHVNNAFNLRPVLKTSTTMKYIWLLRNILGVLWPIAVQ